MEISCGTVLHTEINETIHYVLIRADDGYCGFPKGHMEIGESERETALRETWEETSIRAEIIGGFRDEEEYFVKNNTKKKVIYFTATYSGQTPMHNPGFKKRELLILPYEEAYEALTFQSAKDILCRANEFLKNSKITFDITFLGTCACDFSPKLKNEFKDSFDYDARRASSVLINRSFLIDCGVHAIDSLRILRKELSEISDIFITHLHGDHFNQNNLSKIAESRESPLRIWVREDAFVNEIENVTVVKMAPFEKYNVCGDLFITALPANHDPNAYPQPFLIEKNGKKIFDGCDGAWFLNATYNYLRNQKLDLAVLDCTSGDYVGDYRMAEHNSIPMIRLMLPSLATVSATYDKTRIYLSHIAPSLHKTHFETVNIAKELGAYVAYDGLNLKI